MIAESSLMLVGKVNKTHGINGELSVSFFEPAVHDLISVGSCLIFRLQGIFVPFFVNGVRPRGADALLLSFDGEDSQQKASAFVGLDVFMDADVVKEAIGEEDLDDGLYAAQLIGYTVKDDNDTTVGIIEDIDDSTEDNPLFVVRTGEQNDTLLVPIVDDFIVDIDMDSHIITMELPDGLLEL